MLYLIKDKIISELNGGNKSELSKSLKTRKKDVKRTLKSNKQFEIRDINFKCRKLDLFTTIDECEEKVCHIRCNQVMLINDLIKIFNGEND